MLNGISIDNILFIGSLLLLLGVLASKASARLSVPALVLFLVVGMLAGSEGPGGIPYDDPVSAQFIGVVALVFILFAGGLETDRDTFSRVFWQGFSLATLGVLLTALLVGLCARYVLNVPFCRGAAAGGTFLRRGVFHRAYIGPAPGHLHPARGAVAEAERPAVRPASAPPRVFPDRRHPE